MAGSEQGDPGRKSRQGSETGDTGRAADRQSEHRHFRDPRDKGTASARKRPSGIASIFNEGLCKVAEQYLKKGAKVYIEGRCRLRKWTDRPVSRNTDRSHLQGFNSTPHMFDGAPAAVAAVLAGRFQVAAISAPVTGVRAAPRRRRRRPQQRHGRRYSALIVVFETIDR